MVTHPENIKERCCNLTASVIAATRSLNPSAANFVMTRQAVQAASTSGVNCLTAETARDAQEFTNCLDLVFSNLRELLYWLDLFQQTRALTADVVDILRTEVEQIQDDIAPLVFSSASFNQSLPL